MLLKRFHMARNLARAFGFGDRIRRARLFRVDLMRLEEQGEPFSVLHEDERIQITYPGFSFPQVVATIKGSKENNEAIVCGYLTNHLLRRVKPDIKGLVIS